MVENQSCGIEGRGPKEPSPAVRVLDGVEVVVVEIKSEVGDAATSPDALCKKPPTLGTLELWRK